MKIGCAILAGGKSSRMGEDKALMTYHGENFVERICDELSFFDEKMIARGNNQSYATWEERGWMIIEDDYPAHGPIGGLHSVLKHCKADAMFCVSCDLPLLKKSVAEILCQEMSADVDAVVAVTDDGKVHPLCGIYQKELYKHMEELIMEDKNRLMSMLDDFCVRYIHFDMDHSKQLMNVNTRSDYEKIQDET